MEWSARNPVAISECVCDDCDERAVDCDVVLPDYYPDIAAVLKCIVTPYIHTKQINGDRMVAEGTACIRVWYLDEERKSVHVCEVTQPFTSTFVLKGGTGTNPCCTLSTRIGYVNCRAVSPRKLDIHGAFSVCLRVVCAGEIPLLTEMPDESVHTRTRRIPNTVPTACADKSFTVNEVLDIGNRAPIQTLMRTACVVQMEPPRVLPNKLVLKGLLSLHTVYTDNSESGRVESVDHEIPFSQLVDMEGLNEDWLCMAHIDIASQSVEVTANASGANTLLTLAVKMNACVTCYHTQETCVMVDAFSSEYPLQQETKRVELTAINGVETSRHTIRETVEWPSDEVTEVLDVWVDTAVPQVRMEESTAYVEGTLQMHLLARDNKGEIGYYERSAPYSLPFEDVCGTMRVQVQPLRTEYIVTGRQLEVRVQLEIVRMCEQSQAVECITSLIAEESTPYPPSRAALKICYVSKGESVWEIAKRCHTSVQMVMDENALSEDTLSRDGILLIPMGL